MSGDMPRVWWSPSERAWLSRDDAGRYFSIYSECDWPSLPKDAVELRPVSAAPAAPEEDTLCASCSHRAEHPYSRHLLGDWCSMCGDPATHKVGEEDVTRQFHNLSNYLCCLHFKVAVGDCDSFPYGLGQQISEVDYGRGWTDDA